MICHFNLLDRELENLCPGNTGLFIGGFWRQWYDYFTCILSCSRSLDDCDKIFGNFSVDHAVKSSVISLWKIHDFYE